MIGILIDDFVSLSLCSKDESSGPSEASGLADKMQRAYMRMSSCYRITRRLSEMRRFLLFGELILTELLAESMARYAGPSR